MAVFRMYFSVLLLAIFVAPSAFASSTRYKDDAWLYVLGFLAICGLIGFGQLLTVLKGPRGNERSAQEILDAALEHEKEQGQKEQQEHQISPQNHSEQSK